MGIKEWLTGPLLEDKIAAAENLGKQIAIHHQGDALTPLEALAYEDMMKERGFSIGEKAAVRYAFNKISNRIREDR